MTNASLESNESVNKPLMAKLHKQTESGEFSGSGAALARMQQHRESPFENPKEEDPIIFAKKMQKKQQQRTSHVDNYRSNTTDLKPWDDKPDPAMR